MFEQGLALRRAETASGAEEKVSQQPGDVATRDAVKRTSKNI